MLTIRTFLNFFISIFFIASLISTILMISGETLGGDFFYFNIMVKPEVAAYSYILSCSFDLFILILASYLFKIFFNGSVTNTSIVLKSKASFLDLFFFFLQIFNIYVVIFTTTGSVLRDDGSSNRAVDLFFALFQPFYLSIFYFYANIKRSVLLKNYSFILFLISCLLSGFLGYLFYLAPLCFFMFRLRLKKSSMLPIFIAAVLVLPLFRIYKFFIIKGSDSLVDMVSGYGSYYDLYAIFARVVVDRFSYVSNVIYIQEHALDLTHYFNSSYFPFFQGYPGSFFYKGFLGGSVGNINEFLFNYASGVYGSNAAFPLLAYFYISPEVFILSCLYGMLLIVFCTIVFSAYLDREAARFLTIFSAFTLLAGGWFWPYVNFLQAAIVYFFIVVLSKNTSRRMKR